MSGKQQSQPRPRPDEFLWYHELLMESAPDGYQPWYFRVEAGSKAPALEYGSWKDASNRLTPTEAVEWMKQGGNVGIAGTEHDALVNVDIDDEDETSPDDLKPTLIARTRSRVGTHGWYFEAPGESIPNIPTDEAGEVRADWQYVVAPGSYVETDPESVPENERENAGYYTIERADPVTSLRTRELPDVFIDHLTEREQADIDAELNVELPQPSEGDASDRRSALFDIRAADIVRKEGGSTDTDDRWTALFHGSETDANMSLSSDGFVQCWRHNVTHNALQALAVLSDYSGGCAAVGTPHKGSNAGRSCLENEDGANVWYAWVYAKQNGYVPDGDPVPYSAIKHIVREHDFCAISEIPTEYDSDESLPADAYDGAIDAIETEYDLDPGRDPISSGASTASDGGTASMRTAGNTSEDGGVEAATPNESTGSGTGAQSPADPDGKVPLPDPTPYGFARYNGGYGYWESGGEDQPDEWNEWTNFEIEVTSYLTMDGDGSEELALTIHPRQDESYEVRVPPTAFNEKREFKSEVACGRTTTFTGGEHALAKIKVFVGTQAAPDQVGVTHIGRRGDSLVVPGGSLTDDGWQDEPSARYVERSLGIERKVGLQPERDYTDADDVTSILELLPQTRDDERFLPALGWFYATPLRPLITDLTGEFPVLSVTGNTGAGKTSTLETMWSLLGIEGDPFSANDTTFTAMTTVSATDTLPVWFDEYKPSDMHPGRLDGFHDLIRKSTRGGVVSKGNADQTTTEYHLRAPVCISGEQRFAGPAEQRRSILTTFRESATDPEGDAAHAFAKLSGGSFKTDDGIKHYEGGDLLVHAHAYHRWLLGYDERDVREAWRSAQERVLSLLEEEGISDVDSAGRTALQTVAFGIGLYQAFADEMDASVPIDDTDRDQALVYVANQQGNDGRRESHLDEFVRYLSLAAMENDLEEDRHYTRVYTGERKGEIRVSMSNAYPKVARYVQNHGLSRSAELLEEGDYRQRTNEAAEDDSSYITSYSQNSPPINRAFGIDIADATEAVEGFDSDNFYGRDEQGENGRYGSDEDHWRSDN